jgi:hypothetical protein
MYLRIYKILFSFLLFLSCTALYSQLPYQLIDGREHKYCESCRGIIEDMPPEVLFGIDIKLNGDVYFSMNNKTWFDKIFKNNSYGVSVDLVSEDRYGCNKNTASAHHQSLPMGTILEPVYRPDILPGADALSEGTVYVKIGTLPAALKNKKIEGNLIIVNGNYICYYSNFVNIDRAVWQLLPMGLFTDSLIRDPQKDANGEVDFFTYTKKIQVQVPFNKGSSNFNNSYLQGIYDSLELTKYNIRKIEVRAYSSVEGPEKLNTLLMNRRADTIVQALKKYEPELQRITTLTAENWLDFFKDIEKTKFSDIWELGKQEIKQKLTDKAILAGIEPILAKHRKAIVTIYMESKSAAAGINEDSIFTDFKKAVHEKNITKARDIQKELVERIMDNKLPLDYLNKLEVPATKEFSPLLNDREVYKYLLKATTEYEALDNFLALKKLDPTNGRICYNVCALRFFMWQYGGDTIARKLLPREINALPGLGIDTSLVKRMLINYHILKCEDNMKVFNYDGKDSSLNIIHDIYEGFTLNDEDIYSLAKYYAYYSHQHWAKDIIAPRIDQLDISEDLLFYYVNLLFFNPSGYGDENFDNALLNAINLNNKRFCDFFLPNDAGGASMQLLEYDEIKKMYCSSCKKK